MHALTNIYVIYSAIVFCVITVIPSVHCKICKSVDIRNFASNLNKLRNCTEINGTLYIVLIETTKSESDYDSYVFPELKSITGYVLLYRVHHLTSIGKLFPNLRLIRGLTLFMNYALIIHDLPSLREIGTDKLLYIEKGYVRVAQSPRLCYLNTINWNRIGNDTCLDLQQPKNNNCLPCPQKCNGYCWNQEKCQIFTDNCDIECLGCTKDYSNAHCEVCKNYEDNGICVAQCPSDKYVIRTINKCVTKAECIQRNIDKSRKDANKNWWIHETECLSDCPEGTEYSPEKNTCISCENYCVKYCTATEINNPNAIKNLYGCTHINGSININGLKTVDDVNNLNRNLKSIRVIEGYLLILRNDAIEDLEFLPHLTTIEGRELTSGKAMVIYENRNLKNLWNLDENFSLKIKNGGIGFHDNEQLCLIDIQKFANKIGITYTDTDVSTYSNGACATTAEEYRKTYITQLNSKNVTLAWDRKNPTDELYYTLYYTENYYIRFWKRQDFYRNYYWESISTANNSSQLLNLKPFITYLFYIMVHLKNTTSIRTVMWSFTTLADDPDPPISFTAYPIDHESIRLVWDPTYQMNGILNKYFISLSLEEDSYDITYKRDYCQHPHTMKGGEIDKVKDFFLKSKEEAPIIRRRRYNLEVKQRNHQERPRDPTFDEVNIGLWNIVWPYLYDNKSQSKFGFEDYRNYYYDRFNYFDNHIHKRSSEITSSRKKSSVEFTVTADADTTDMTIKRLKQYSVYVFYLIACNKEVDERRLCSTVLQTSARTLKNPKADDLSDDVYITINQYDVIVTWFPPEKPNSFIVSYNIVYGRDLEHSQNTTVCIPQEVYRREKKHTLKNMLSGSYYLMVQAVSLAGPGNFTQRKYFEIARSATNPFWLIFFAVVLLLIGVVAVLVFLRIKRKRALELRQRRNAEMMYRRDEWEMESNEIQLQKVAGQGTFGVVYMALLKKKKKFCAVKTVSDNATIQERINFLKEASIMKQFTNGYHIVQLLAVVSKEHKPLVVMEWTERGDLKQYLRSLQDSSQNFASIEIYRMAIEIADGLAYLTSKKILHRDLAARNCMVTTDRTVKIGDLSISRDVYETDYYKKGTEGMLPIRWMSPESIADGICTSDSDIWSYGIVLWEIATLAEQPYQDLANEQVLQYVVAKGTLARPTKCPNLLWDIMRSCWDWYPSNRPTCFKVIEKLQDHVGQDFKLISYYHSQEGQEFLTTHGSVKANNPPAQCTEGFLYEEMSCENDPLNNDHKDHLNKSEFLPPSSSQQGSRLSGDFH